MTRLNSSAYDKVVILADGGLLYERNARLKEGNRGAEDPAPVDFTKLPGAVAQALGVKTVPSKANSYFFAVGSQSAEAFLERMSSTWTVQAFPMRAFGVACACGKLAVRFTSAIAWALGNVAGRRQEETVVVISNDPAIVLPIRFARDQGVDARIAWPDPLGEEARFFATKNNVDALVLDVQEGALFTPHQSFGSLFLQDERSPSVRQDPRRRKSEGS